MGGGVTTQSFNGLSGEVRFPEIDGGASIWELGENTEGLKVEVTFRSDSGCSIGGKGYRIFNIEAGHPGSFDLSFRRVEPWSSKVLEEKHCSLSFGVK